MNRYRKERKELIKKIKILKNIFRIESEKDCYVGVSNNELRQILNLLNDRFTAGDWDGYFLKEPKDGEGWVQFLLRENDEVKSE